jgi:hypothetical protein
MQRNLYYTLAFAQLNAMLTTNTQNQKTNLVVAMNWIWTLKDPINRIFAVLGYSLLLGLYFF